jgi:hypothetical protein
MSEDPLAAADKLKKQAQEVITELGLTEKWGKIGELYLVGSARFGLMASTNIDFEVYVENPEISEGFSAIAKIAEVPGVKQIQYLNFMDNSSDPGLYWRIDFEDSNGALWDIDNWLVPYSHPFAGMADRFADSMERVLNDNLRRTILTIKHVVSSEMKVRGIDIYCAVLRDHISTPEAFIEWRKQNPPIDGIVNWSPEG